MSNSLASPVNQNQVLLGDNGENPSGFGGERDGRIPVNEDIASMESDDGRDHDCDDDDDDWVSDHESFSSVKPIIRRTNNQSEIEVDGPIQSNEDDKLHREGFNFDSPTDEANNLHPKAGIDGLIELNESDGDHQTIKKRFISGVKDLGVNVQVEHIHRNLFKASAITLAKLHAFLIHERAVKDKNGGHANVSHAWFAASKDQINKIVTHGFNHDHIEMDGVFGHGLYLATYHSLIERLKLSTADDDGMRHILLCRVILGRVEVVTPGSKQCHPSSDEFQSGVDTLESPKKVIVWSTHLNTHVLPEFVISFKILSCHNGPAINKVQFDMPHFPHMVIEDFLSGLSKILPSEDMKKVNEYRQKYLDHKISRHDMLLGFIIVAGDGPLMMVLKDFKEQQQVRGD